MADIKIPIKGDNSDFIDSLEDSQKQTDSFASNLKGVGSKAGAGLALGAAGGAALLGSAIGGIGIKAFSTASDIEAATKQIQSALGITEAQAQQLGDVGVDVFKNNFTGSIGEATAAVGLTALQLKQLDPSQLQVATENALRLSDAFGTDMESTLNATNVLMTQFGLNQQQAFDFLSSGFQKGIDSSGDFLDSVSEYGNLFAQSGADAGQFFSLLESGLQGGVLGTDKAADAFKEFGLRVTDGSDASLDALATIFGTFISTTDQIEDTNKELEKLQANLEKASSAKTPDAEKIDALTTAISQAETELQGLEAMNGKFQAGIIEFEGGAPELFHQLATGAMTTADAFTLVQQAINDVNNPLLQTQLGVALMGTQFEDLGVNAAAGMSLAGTSIDDLSGSTETLDAQYDTLSAKFEMLGRKAETALAPIGEGLMEAVEMVLPALEGIVSFLESTLIPSMAMVGASFGNLFTSSGEGGFADELAGISEAWSQAMMIFEENETFERIGESISRLAVSLGFIPEGTTLAGEAILSFEKVLEAVEIGIKAGVLVIESIATALETAANLADQLAQGFKGIQDGLSSLSAGSTLDGIVSKLQEGADWIPSWMPLIGESPSPLAVGLHFAAKEARAFPDLNQSLGLDGLNALDGFMNNSMSDSESTPGDSTINLMLDGQIVETVVSGYQGVRRQARAAMGGATAL